MGIFGRILWQYNHLLHKYKYPTQIVTGGFLWCAGDVLCQGLVHLSSPSEHSTAIQSNGHLDDRKEFKLDWNRIGRMTVYGLAVSAPVYAFWYSWLDRSVHRYFAKVHSTPTLPPWLQRRLMAEAVDGPAVASVKRPPFWHRWNPKKQLTLQDARSIHGSMRTWQMIGAKLTADCFVFDPLYLTLFFTTTSLMEGLTPKAIKEKLQADLLHTYIVDVAVWAPLQTVNFRWVPVAYQALAVQMCNIGWNAYLSFVQHGGH